MINYLKINLLVLICIVMIPDTGCCQKLSETDSIKAGNFLDVAKSFANQKLWDSAQTYLSRASSIYMLNEDWIQQLKCENSIGYIYMLQYDYASAIDHFIAYEKEYLHYIKSDHDELGFFYGNIGYAYGRLGQYINATHYWTKNLRLNLNLHDNFDQKVTNAYMNLGGLYRKIGRYEKSLDQSFKALTIADSLNDINNIVNCYNDLGLTYRRLGEFKAAGHYFKKLLDVDIDHIWYKYEHYLNNLALVYQSSGEYEDAVKLYEQILDTLAVKPGKYKPIGSMKSAALINLANINREMGQLEMAEKYAMEAISIRASTYGQQTSSLIPMYAILGEIKYDQSSYNEALEVYNKASALFESLENQFNVSNLHVFVGKAEVYAAQEEYEKALEFCQIVIKQIVENFDEEDVKANPDISEYILDQKLLFKTLRLKSRIFGELYRQTDDIKMAEIAHEINVLSVTLIQKIWRELQTVASKNFISDEKYELFESSISTAFQLYQKTDERKYLESAFEFFEISKANLLKENLFDRQFKLFSNIPDSLKEKESQLLSEIKYLEDRVFKLNRSKDTLLLSSSKTRLLDKQLAYETLQKQLKRKYERYYNLKLGGLQYDLKSFQDKVLFKKQMVVQYFVGENKIYAMLVTKNDIQLVPLEISEIKPLVTAYYNAVLNQDGSQLDTNSYGLYKYLLNDLLVDKKEVNHLIIIADDLLAGLPFETLLTRAPTTENKHEAKPFLLRDFEVSYHYSADLMASNFFSTKKGLGDKFIGFAPLVGESPDFKDLRRSANGRMLSALPGTKDEVKNIASIFGGEFKIGGDATEGQFKAAFQNASILHVASHAVIDPKNPLYSKLVFSKSSEEEEDGFLHAYELYNMSVNSSMVSLSACNTGIGKYFKGEGVQSLGRGFMYAGAPSVMMSLWAVPDKATTKIMTYFYEEIKDGKSEAKALRLAKLKYLDQADKNTIHPYYWGAFIYVGHHSPDSRMKPAQYLLIFVILFVLIVFYSWKIKERGMNEKEIVSKEK